VVTCILVGVVLRGCLFSGVPPIYGAFSLYSVSPVSVRLEQGPDS